MRKCVAVFRSRSESMSFLGYLKNYNIPCRTVETPKEAHLGCGTSVEFPVTEIARAMSIVKSKGFNSFYSFLMIEKNGFRTTTTKI